VQVDGSGLSRANRVTARQVAALIEAVLLQDERSAAVYRESLAVAGERGTLSDRMEHSPARGRVRAKTGFIDGTSALSGIADAADGRQFVFSILVNFPIVQALNPSVWKPMQDAVCERLVRGRP
jgi:D-alanyl-D-alanine carboxypeptidase/D-alanyl-D-alanine-endopeptidase (penicillin-binding protein 4)